VCSFVNSTMCVCMYNSYKAITLLGVIQGLYTRFELAFTSLSKYNNRCNGCLLLAALSQLKCGNAIWHCLSREISIYFGHVASALHPQALMFEPFMTISLHRKRRNWTDRVSNCDIPRSSVRLVWRAVRRAESFDIVPCLQPRSDGKDNLCLYLKNIVCSYKVYK